MPFCRGIFVLSEYLKTQFENELSSKNLSHVPVYALTHPTDTNVKCFSYTEFYKNPNKQLIHIGGWLRNVYSFYNITLPETTVFKYGLFTGNKTCTLYKTKTDNIKKIALRGKGMNNYYPLENILQNLKSSLEYTDLLASQNASGNVSQNCHEELYNNWSKHFYDDIVKKVSSISFLEYLQNDEYDKLMTENIVYINLVDASAVNTIIECIVRTTPIIVNKHPAVVELLGKDYPLYFTASSTDYSLINVQVYNMLCSDRLIRRAHKYLKHMDKSRFHIKSFVTEFEKILINIKN